MYENYIEIIRHNKRRMNVIFDQIDKGIKDLALCEKDFVFVFMKCLIPVSDAVLESNSVKNYHIENKDVIIDKILLDKAIKEVEQIKNEDIFYFFSMLHCYI